MRKPSDWEILAVVLMRRLGNKVELTQTEIADARELCDPIEHETALVTYRESQLARDLLTVELRSRPRDVPSAVDAFIAEVLSGDDRG